MHQIYFAASLLLLITRCNVSCQSVNRDYKYERQTSYYPSQAQPIIYQSRQPQPTYPSTQPQPMYQSTQSPLIYQSNPPVNDWNSATRPVNNQPTEPQNIQIDGRYAPRPNDLIAESISRGNEQFSLKFFKFLVDKIPSNDFIVSPFSVYSLLATLTEGATPQSQTLKELLSVLNIEQGALSRLGDIYSEILKKLMITTDTIQLSTYQGIFNNYTYPLRTEFKNTVQQKYNTKCEEIESGRSADDILRKVNGIVSNATGGYIKAAFSKRELQSAVMLLLSVIHFKGQWTFPFNKTHTKVEPFFDEYGNQVSNVEMMFERSPVAYAPIKELESHVVELPYGQQNRLKMIVILPRKNVTLSQVAEKLTNYNLNNLFVILQKSLQDFEEEDIEIHLPKFSTTSDLTLNDILQRMGVSSVFSSDAQLNRMNPDIFLSKLVHKAKIQVDEEGTIASAVTGGVFANKSSAPRFYANRPFLYLIVEKDTQLVLFCGQMRNNPIPHSKQQRSM